MKLLSRLLAGSLSVLCIGLIASIFLSQKPLPTPITQKPSVPAKIPTQSVLFVPYWETSSQQLPATYDTYIYDGVRGSKDGLDKEEQGYKNMETFLASVPSGKQTLLMLSLTDTSFNSSLLSDKTLQEKMSEEVSLLASTNHFSGIVVDLELSALGLDSVVNGISQTMQSFAHDAKLHHLSFGVTFYGDTFYRVRPYDIAKISSLANQIYIMAYDLHKANGNPGPNFPLHDDEYDLAQMISDFSHNVPKEKITVVYGLFGYDWKINNKGLSLGLGEPLTANEIAAKFLAKCAYQSCRVKHDPSSLETEITYIDEDGYAHQVWSDDLQSVTKKADFLQQLGIFHTGFWAYGYF